MEASFTELSIIVDFNNMPLNSENIVYSAFITFREKSFYSVCGGFQTGGVCLSVNIRIE
jgi:hypothetical protein